MSSQQKDEMKQALDELGSRMRDIREKNVEEVVEERLLRERREQRQAIRNRLEKRAGNENV